MKTKILGLLVLVAALSACAQNTDSSDSTRAVAAPTGNGSGNQPKPEEKFDFRRMLYGTSGVCGKQGFYFKYLSADDVVIGQRNGQDVMVDSRILLYPDKRFEVEITEKYIMNYTATGYAYKKQKSRYIAGNYVETDGKLVLGDLLEIVGRDVDKKIVASVLYKKNVMSMGLANHSVAANMVWSSSAIKSERETCPYSDEVLGDFSKFQARQDRSVLQLNALYTNQPIFVDGFYVKSLQLVLEKDGSYAIVAEASAIGSGSVATYFVDSGYWQQSGGRLVFYHGVLSLGFNSDEATLRFTRDMILFGSDKAYTLPMTGKTVSLKFGPSNLTKDDLTDTYR